MTAVEAQDLFPPLAPWWHRALLLAALGPCGRVWPGHPSLREACVARGVRVVDGVAAGVSSGLGGGRRVDAVRTDGGPDITCRALAVAGGWSTAVGEWLEQPLPVGPTKGQIVHLDVEAETASWPIAQPLLTHYLVPWPGGRVACGGTFESAAGFRPT